MWKIHFHYYIKNYKTLDGTYIPKQIREVQRKLRENSILFPSQQKPSKSDVQQWQYFIDSISVQGRLHVPLGNWIRTPDQHFRYLISVDNKVVYKRNKQKWGVFCSRTPRSRRLVQIKLHVGSIPEGCRPTKVIETSSYIIALTGSGYNPVPEIVGHDTSYRWTETQQLVLGQYEINDELLGQLGKQWHQVDNLIVCATDGGLKDSIGTSSYAMFLPGITSAVPSGVAGEYQPRNSASSTRQELLGQLAIEYWLRHLQDRWGTPRCGVKLMLITDSQASIDIIAKVPNVGTIRDMIAPEMDVGLEIFHQQLQT